MFKRKPASKQKLFQDLQIGDKISLKKGDTQKWADVQEVWHNERTTCVQLKVGTETIYKHHTNMTQVTYKT